MPLAADDLERHVRALRRGRDVVERHRAVRRVAVEDLAALDPEPADRVVVDGVLPRGVRPAGALADLVAGIDDRPQHVVAVGERRLVHVDPLVVAPVVVRVAPADGQAFEQLAVRVLTAAVEAIGGGEARARQRRLELLVQDAARRLRPVLLDDARRSAVVQPGGVVGRGPELVDAPARVVHVLVGGVPRERAGRELQRVAGGVADDLRGRPGGLAVDVPAHEQVALARVPDGVREAQDVAHAGLAAVAAGYVRPVEPDVAWRQDLEVRVQLSRRGRDWRGGEKSGHEGRGGESPELP
jgi:hypothetical protein